jgi:glycosyltransferase involved in cell wall biosynthesis
VYFKAADVLVLPYTHVFQSGVLFLGYSFGLPAIAADVGDLKEEIIEGETGFVFRPKDSADLAAKINKYFQDELFLNLETRRARIKVYANERYSWNKVAAITTSVYSRLYS